MSEREKIFIWGIGTACALTFFLIFVKSVEPDPCLTTLKQNLLNPETAKIYKEPHKGLGTRYRVRAEPAIGTVTTNTYHCNAAADTKSCTCTQWR